MINFKRAFTLLEIVIAMLVVVILALVAVASYHYYILSANRSDAIQTLLSIQLAEEKHRLQNSTYGTLAEVWGGVATSENGSYAISVSNLSATSYTITATAVGSQTADTSCTTITLTYSNGTTTHSPATCWSTD